MKIVLFQSSSTQRVVISVNSSVLISKEWKKKPEDDWITGKSIEIPKDKLESVQKVISAINTHLDSDPKELAENLEKCGVTLDE